MTLILQTSSIHLYKSISEEMSKVFLNLLFLVCTVLIARLLYSVISFVVKPNLSKEQNLNSSGVISGLKDMTCPELAIHKLQVYEKNRKS